MPPPATTTSNAWRVTETMLAGELAAVVDVPGRAYVALPGSTRALGPLKIHVDVQWACVTRRRIASGIEEALDPRRGHPQLL
jgi:hypothetical protein